MTSSSFCDYLLSEGVGSIFDWGKAHGESTGGLLSSFNDVNKGSHDTETVTDGIATTTTTTTTPRKNNTTNKEIWSKSFYPVSSPSLRLCNDLSASSSPAAAAKNPNTLTTPMPNYPLDDDLENWLAVPLFASPDYTSRVKKKPRMGPSPQPLMASSAVCLRHNLMMDEPTYRHHDHVVAAAENIKNETSTEINSTSASYSCSQKTLVSSIPTATATTTVIKNVARSGKRPSH
jgi:hypothetical protein